MCQLVILEICIDAKSSVATSSVHELQKNVCFYYIAPPQPDSVAISLECSETDARSVNISWTVSLVICINLYSILKAILLVCVSISRMEGETMK